MRKSILIINENVDEAKKIKERLVSAYNDVEYVTSIHDAVNHRHHRVGITEFYIS